MKRILVIGESCRDVFVHCHAERLAPDLPVPVLRIIEKKTNPGMAKNVERNVKAIYPHCDLLTNSNWRNVTKTRYVHRDTNHTFIRVDAEPRVPPMTQKDLRLNEYDIVVVSDYNKGFLSEADVEEICKKHECVFVDTKKILGPWARRAMFIKINNFEHERSKHAMTKGLQKKTIVTRGEFGADFRGRTYPVPNKVEVKDSTGAGDSFFAALVVRYAETGDIDEAIHFANDCASRVVAQKGVSLIRRPAAWKYEKSKVA